MSGAKLHFVIGGAQKSGTSTLDEIFRRHRQLQMASKKETHFFDDETRDWEQPDYAALDAFFPDDDDRLRGEATPITLYWQPAIRRMQVYNPDLKIILLLRNPVTRAFSQWCMEYEAGFERLAFSDAIRDGRKRLASDARTSDAHRLYSYVERGFYGQQIAYLQRHFPRQNILCEVFEEFLADRTAVLRRMTDFLGIAPFQPWLPPIHRWPRKAFDYPSTLEAEDAAYLAGLYADDTKALETLLGHPIPLWRAPLVDAT